MQIGGLDMSKTTNTQKRSIFTLPGRVLSAVNEAICRSHDFRRCF